MERLGMEAYNAEQGPAEEGMLYLVRGHRDDLNRPVANAMCAGPGVSSTPQDIVKITVHKASQ